MLAIIDDASRRFDFDIGETIVMGRSQRDSQLYPQRARNRGLRRSCLKGYISRSRDELHSMIESSAGRPPRGRENKGRLSARDGQRNVRDGEVDEQAAAMWAENDVFQKPAYAGKLQKTIPNAQLILIKDAAHWLMEERPEEISGHLIAFLDGE